MEVLVPLVLMCARPPIHISRHSLFYLVMECMSVKHPPPLLFYVKYNVLEVCPLHEHLLIGYVPHFILKYPSKCYNFWIAWVVCNSLETIKQVFCNILIYIEQISIIFHHIDDIRGPTNLSRIVKYNKQCTVQTLYIFVHDMTYKS